MVAEERTPHRPLFIANDRAAGHRHCGVFAGAALHVAAAAVLAA